MAKLFQEANLSELLGRLRAELHEKTQLNLTLMLELERCRRLHRDTDIQMDIMRAEIARLRERLGE